MITSITISFFLPDLPSLPGAVRHAESAALVPWGRKSLLLGPAAVAVRSTAAALGGETCIVEMQGSQVPPLQQP